MFARLSRYQGSPVPAEGQLSDSSETVLQQMQELPGFCGIYLFVDRATGKTMSLTLWEDASAMRSSEAPAARIREQAAHREGAGVVSVERFEVAFHHLQP